MDSPNFVEGFYERLKEALGAQSDYEVAVLLGRSQSSVHNWKKRGNVPISECIRVASSKNVSLDWLIMGEAPKSTHSDMPILVADAIAERGQNYMSGYSAIPIYDIEAAAGSGRLFDDELVETTIQFDTEQLQRDGLDPAHVVGVRVRGDSMGETLHDGDRVLVDRSSRTPDGVFLLRMDDGLRIKRVQRVAGGGWRLISDNAHYPPELVDPLSSQNVEIIGECVMRLGRIS